MNTTVTLCALGALVVGVGCARGSGDTDTFEELPGYGGYGLYGGSGGTAGTGGAGAFGGAGATGGTGGTGATGGAGATGGTGGTGGVGGGGCDFSPVNSCHTATAMTNVCGDEGNATSTVQGIGAGWHEIYIQECVASITSYPDLSFTVTLTSPSGMDYDLYVYEGDETSTACADVPAKATGNPESYTADWTDVPLFDNDKWHSFEIRHVNGTDCITPWTLTVEGNTVP